jgi:F-type H+-transporting ATPase subunit b
MELLQKLGINWKLLVAQIVNFLILLFVLYRFAYKPVLKLLNDRTKKIEKGLKDTELAHRKLQEITQKEKEMLSKARIEAQEILKKTEDMAKKSKDEMAQEAKAQAEKIIADAKSNIESEKTKMLREVKAEVAELVVMATEKVIGEKIDEKKDKELIDKLVHG